VFLFGALKGAARRSNVPSVNASGLVNLEGLEHSEIPAGKKSEAELYNDHYSYTKFLSIFVYCLVTFRALRRINITFFL
jgi:hypothetical protein